MEKEKDSIPPDIQKNIDEEYYLIERDSPSYEKHGEGWNGDAELKRIGAAYGYQLAQQEIAARDKEIERLKGLIERELKESLKLDAVICNWNDGELKRQQDVLWNNFKIENNL